MELDWERAMQCRMGAFILRQGGEGSAAVPAPAERGEGTDALHADALHADALHADALHAVFEVFWNHSTLYVAIFEYYASIDGDSVHSISLNEWTTFLDDNGLVDATSEACKRADMDRLFIAVDTASAGGGGCGDKQLGRSEFLHILVRLAVIRYMQAGEASSVPEALEKLLFLDIGPNCDPTHFQPRNDFRSDCCYIPETTAVLAKREGELRHIFEAAYSQRTNGGGRVGGGAQLGNLLTLAQWVTFLRDLELLGADLSEGEAVQAFVCSRMAVIDGRSAIGRAKERCLPFEGFLEGLVRLTRLKALPTDGDLAASGCADAGTYVRRLRDEEGGKYRAFLTGRVNVQPVARATEHLISLIIRNIEVAVSLADRIDGKLTAVEVKKWITLMEAKKAGLVIETGTQK